MEKYNDLPLYIFNVDENPTTEEGVDFVALVDKPAIKKSFVAFNEAEKRKLAFTVTSEDRRIVSGPLMLADTPIYRRQKWDTDVVEEFYVTFPASAIERTVCKFFAQGNQSNVNIMHDSGQIVQGVTMFESFISDTERGIMPMKGYEDAPNGSWFGSFKVNNEEVWQSIKDGTFTGFSVEGLFARIPSGEVSTVETDEALMRQIVEILENTE